MAEKPLAQLIREGLERENLQLPVFNRVALEVDQLIREDDYSGDQLAAVIEQDMALAAGVLRVANSAFYAGLMPVKTVKDAAVRLGANTLSSLTMLITQKQMYVARVRQFKEWMNRLWSHALGTAVASKWLAQNLGFRGIAEEAFMAGLLHDIGKLVLLRILDELVVNKTAPTRLSVPLVQEVVKDLHPEFGRMFLEKFNMPGRYATVAGGHHEPGSTADDTVMNLVRLSNLTCHKLGIGLDHDPDLMLSATPEAILLMAKDILLAELQVQLMDQLKNLGQAV